MKNAIKYNQYGAKLTQKWAEKAFKELGMPIPKEMAQVKQNQALITALSGQFQQIQTTLQGAPAPAPQPAGPPLQTQPMQEPADASTGF
jgi:hypothetical protein